jgi:hypothetical protein
MGYYAQLKALEIERRARGEKCDNASACVTELCNGRKPNENAGKIKSSVP